MKHINFLRGDLTFMNREEFLITCAEGNQEQVINAIKSGADPNEIFYPGSGIIKNALDIAVSMNNTEAAAALLANGANPDFRDSKGRTALMFSVLVSSEMVKVLLEGGANPNIRDMNGRTALTMAVAGRDMSIEKFFYFMIQTGGLKVHGWEDWLFTALISSVYARQEQLDTVKNLLDNGADINLCDNSGMNAVNYAMLSGDDEIFAILTGIN